MICIWNRKISFINFQTGIWSWTGSRSPKENSTCVHKHLKTCTPLHTYQHMYAHTRTCKKTQIVTLRLHSFIFLLFCKLLEEKWQRIKVLFACTVYMETAHSKTQSGQVLRLPAMNIYLEVASKHTSKVILPMLMMEQNLSFINKKMIFDT